MAKQFNAKSTKNEILDAYNDLASDNTSLAKQINALNKELDNLRKEKNSLETAIKKTDSKETNKEANKNTTSEEKPHTSNLNYTIATIINELKQLRPGFSKAVSELSDKLTSEATTLEQLRKTSTSEQERLKTLYQIETIEGTLEQLITSYQEKSKAYSQELKEKQIVFQEEMLNKRTTWNKEQEEHTTQIKERDANNKKSQDRDQTEYTYSLTQARNLEKDTYEQQKKSLEKELQDLKEVKEKEWFKREETISNEEKQYEEAKTKVEEFPKELEAAIKKAKQEGSGIAYHQAKVKSDLVAKEVEGKKRVYELKIQALEETIAKQAAQVASLSSQLTTVLKQGQELAIKAIEGAANESTFQAVREIAIEQAKTQQKNK
jgi:predicted  nucleic acid-binding Zn-ribbon protein